MYYNTNNLTGMDLISAWKNANKQKEIVLQYYKLNSEVSMTPSFVWGELIKYNLIEQHTPLTSIRRAISDLTLDCLKKLDRTTIGIYGAKEHYWIYSKFNQTILSL